MDAIKGDGADFNDVVNLLFALLAFFSFAWNGNRCRISKSQPPKSRHLDSSFGYEEDEVITMGTSFSLHAATRIKKGRRQALEQIIPYAAHGSFSNKRLSLESDGDRRYTQKTPWHDGTVAIKLNPEELMEKFAALVPILRFNLLRYSGVFAPNHKMRSKIVPSRKIKPDSCVDRELPPTIRYKWHELLKRILWHQHQQLSRPL